MAIGNLRGALGTMAVGLLACSLIVLMGRGRLSPQPSLLRQKRWSPAMGTNAVFLPTHPASRPDHKALLDVATFQQLAENPNCCNDPVVPVEEVYQDFNMCQSCLAECSAYKANDCSFGSMSAVCLPDALLTECEECTTKGCTQVVEFIEGNAILNETSNGDNITKVEIFTELAWAHAQKEAVSLACRLLESLLYLQFFDLPVVKLFLVRCYIVLLSTSSDLVKVSTYSLVHLQVADLPVLKKCIDEASTVGEQERRMCRTASDLHLHGRVGGEVPG